MEVAARTKKLVPFNEEKPLSNKFRITVEPIGFLFFIAVCIQVITNQNFLLNKVCRINFNASANFCDVNRINMNHLSANINSSLLMEKVQNYANILLTYASLINNIPAVFVALFLGPWSDRNGRKFTIAIPIVGAILSTLIYLINFYLLHSWPAEYILIGNVPMGLFGGVPVLVMGLNSYLVDVSTSKLITARLAILAGIIVFAILISDLFSIYLYKRADHMSAWLIALGALVMAFMYATAVIVDSKGTHRQKKVGPLVGKVVNNAKVVIVEYTMPNYEKKIIKRHRNVSKFLCAAKKMWKCISITFRVRIGYRRDCVCLLLSSLLLRLLSTETNNGITYLFTRKQFSWKYESQFFIYLVSAHSIAFIGTLIVLPIMSNYFKIRDSIIGIISLIGQTCACLCVAFAVSPLMIYLSAIGMLLAPGIQVIILSLLSKIVGKEDTIYVFSLVACLELIGPLIASPIFNAVYNASLKSFLGTSFLFESGIQMIQIIFLAVVLYLQLENDKLMRKLFFVQPHEHQPRASLIRNIKTD